MDSVINFEAKDGVDDPKGTGEEAIKRSDYSFHVRLNKNYFSPQTKYKQF